MLAGDRETSEGGGWGEEANGPAGKAEQAYPYHLFIIIMTDIMRKYRWLSREFDIVCDIMWMLLFRNGGNGKSRKRDMGDMALRFYVPWTAME